MSIRTGRQAIGNRYLLANYWIANFRYRAAASGNLGFQLCEPFISTILVAMITAMAGSCAMAGARQEYELDMDAYHQLNEQIRLYLSASITDTESAGSNKGQGAAYLDITLKGVVRERLHMADWAREREVLGSHWLFPVSPLGRRIRRRQ